MGRKTVYQVSLSNSESDDSPPSLLSYDDVDAEFDATPASAPGHAELCAALQRKDCRIQELMEIIDHMENMVDEQEIDKPLSGSIPQRRRDSNPNISLQEYAERFDALEGEMLEMMEENATLRSELARLKEEEDELRSLLTHEVINCEHFESRCQELSEENGKMRPELKYKDNIIDSLVNEVKLLEKELQESRLPPSPKGLSFPPNPPTPQSAVSKTSSERVKRAEAAQESKVQIVYRELQEDRSPYTLMPGLPQPGSICPRNTDASCLSVASNLAEGETRLVPAVPAENGWLGRSESFGLGMDLQSELEAARTNESTTSWGKVRSAVLLSKACASMNNSFEEKRPQKSLVVPASASRPSAWELLRKSVPSRLASAEPVNKSHWSAIKKRFVGEMRKSMHTSEKIRDVSTLSRQTDVSTRTSLWKRVKDQYMAELRVSGSIRSEATSVHQKALVEAGTQCADPVALVEAGTQCVDSVALVEAGTQCADPVALVEAGTQCADPVALVEAGTQCADPVALVEAGTQCADPVAKVGKRVKFVVRIDPFCQNCMHNDMHPGSLDAAGLANAYVPCAQRFRPSKGISTLSAKPLPCYGDITVDPEPMF